jgi:nucleoside-diphosphate-sugar epimerase
MSKVLITGAGGFIGYHLTKQLIDQGCKILCIDNFTRIPKDEDISILQSNSKVEWL